MYIHLYFSDYKRANAEHRVIVITVHKERYFIEFNLRAIFRIVLILHCSHASRRRVLKISEIPRKSSSMHNFISGAKKCEK